MPRFLLGWLLSLGGAAIGLILSALLLGSDFQLHGIWGFVVSLVVFAILSGLLGWIVLKILVKHAGPIVALTGLIATFLALLVTSIVTSGLDINGWGWIWGTVIVWILGMVIWLIPGPWRDFDRARRGS